MAETRIATVINTDSGWVGLGRTEVGLRRSTLPQPTKAAAAAELGADWSLVDESADALLAKAAHLVREHLAGRSAAPDFPLDLRGIPPFTLRVLQACHTIPCGETRSYADLAKAAGNPKAARAVGQAMRRNPLPLIVPCHRVIGSDGSLVGFAGGEQALDIKAALLEREGVRR